MLHIDSQPSLHFVFETLGYAVGFAVYKRGRREVGDILDERQRWSIIAAASVGALLGSRVLGVLNDAPEGLSVQGLITPAGGKTIVGGLLGGWAAVEIIKKFQSIRTRTGDLFAVPLCLGVAVGRVGCLLAGRSDDTYGSPTSLPWAVDFGDGVGRHPTQAYEILFLVALAFALSRFARRPHVNGLLFRVFLAAYLVWRIMIDFLKPQHLIAGMSCIQWASVLGLAFLAVGSRETSPTHQVGRSECASS